MAIEFNVTVGGFDDLFKRMDELREEVGKGKTEKAWRKALLYAMEPVLQAAKASAPKDSGQLAEGIYLTAHKPRARDKRSATYQGEMYMARVTVSPLREDSVLSLTLNKRSKFQTVWGNKKPVAISQEFGNARTPAQPFLRMSMDNTLVQSRLASAVWEQIQKLSAKKV